MTQYNLFSWDEVVPLDVKSKVCIKCGENKPLEYYSLRDGDSYRRTECKSCRAHLNRVRNELRSTVAEPPSDHTCPLCHKDAEAVAGQGGLQNGSWCLDHCHITNKFRGWLCHKCNRSLGNLGDDIDVLKRAIQYLSA